MIDVTDQHPFRFDSIRRTAHSSATETIAASGLAPRIRTVAAGALPPADRSVPLALGAVVGGLGLGLEREETAARDDCAVDSETSDGRRALESTLTAVVLLEGYARLRAAVCAAAAGADRGDRSLMDGRRRQDVGRLDAPLEVAADGSGAGIDRDDAVLASDHLHAAAYATVRDGTGTDRRALECYRLLITGSRRLTEGLNSASRTDDGREIDDRDGPAPATVLAETAVALAGAATDVPTETRTALRRYSHGVMTALASLSPSEGDAATARVAAVLTAAESRSAGAAEPVGRSVTDGAVSEPNPEPELEAAAPDSATRAAPTVDRTLERAREALETVAGSVNVDNDGDDAATTDDASHPSDAGSPPTPLERLERTTRLPFQQG